MDGAARGGLWVYCVREGLGLESSRSVPITNRYFAIDTHVDLITAVRRLLDVFRLYLKVFKTQTDNSRDYYRENYKSQFDSANLFDGFHADACED